MLLEQDVLLDHHLGLHGSHRGDAILDSASLVTRPAGELRNRRERIEHWTRVDVTLL